MEHRAQGESELTNERAAGVLDEIGDMLDILGESTFRVRAYHKAAASVRGLTRPIADIYREGGVKALGEIPGVGSHTALRLEELIATGRLPYYDELREKIPESLTELMVIPGIGPKKAKKIYDTLGVSNLDELTNAIAEHKIEHIPGFGRKTEENILRGIHQYDKMHERILLSQAYPIAHKVVGLLAQQPFVDRASTAGSLRRMKETIGDIDLLASSDRPLKVMEYFTTLPQVAYILATGETKSSIIVKNGLQIDLRVVAPDQYGAALQYFTGSKPHNIHLRDIAKKRGLKINEYGVFESGTDRRLGGRTEEEVYAIMDMETPPPTIREDKGEIEAAMRRSLPRLIRQEDIRGDFHVHTKWSDGVNDIEEMVEMARSLGYRFVTISDHAEKLRIAGGLTKEELQEQLEAIGELKEKYDDIEIFTGMETNIDNDGEVDFGPEVLRKLDVVIGSIHGGFQQSKEQLTRRMVRAIENPYVGIIAHPTGRILGQRPPYDIDLHEVFKAAAATGTFLELNAYPNRLDLKDDHLREARDVYGCKFAINTDAHVAGNMLYMEYGVATAQRGWLTKEDFLNTYEVDEIRRMLREKR